MVKSSPSVVVFDLGKVLLDFDFRVFAEGLAQDASVSADDVMEAIVQSSILVEYESGRTSSSVFFEQVKNVTGYRGSYESFECLFGEIFTPLDEMIAAQERISMKGIPTYICSNTNEIAIRTIRRLFRFFDRFSGYVLSHEHQSMKPDSHIYRITESVVGKSGADLVFIDDKEENISAAIARGWHGIVHVTPSETLAALDRLGILASE
tara:strand:+ start:393 stop:1016 length:624 start_codon:yes stop_codon:yes gene_type:complete